ncbi:MAG: 30S ribosomal protein S15 [Deltaproteobacteria bacterium]|nr:30S ribosomal protein S15 [Deltaproteobacteria bacterium]MCX7952657.1 30S ribosomal protein S15 [Deltaproteobacteria bacterium]
MSSKKAKKSKISLPQSKTEYLFGKQNLIQSFGSPGSVETRIALLTSRIAYLSEHLKKHKKDFSSRRGLLMLVGQRRRLLRYLQRTRPEKHQEMLSTLGIRG